MPDPQKGRKSWLERLTSPSDSEIEEQQQPAREADYGRASAAPADQGGEPTQRFRPFQPAQNPPPPAPAQQPAPTQPPAPPEPGPQQGVPAHEGFQRPQPAYAGDQRSYPEQPAPGNETYEQRGATFGAPLGGYAAPGEAPAEQVSLPPEPAAAPEPPVADSPEEELVDELPAEDTRSAGTLDDRTADADTQLGSPWEGTDTPVTSSPLETESSRSETPRLGGAGWPASGEAESNAVAASPGGAEEANGSTEDASADERRRAEQERRRVEQERQQQVDELQHRWLVTQAQILDDPRDAVREAGLLIGDALQFLTTTLASHRDRIEGSWKNDSELSTDELRDIMRRYRTLFQYVLSVTQIPEK